MRLIITTPARNKFKDLLTYHRRQGATITARKIRSDINKKVQVLKEFPPMGQVEEMLEHLEEGHRYLVVGNHKVIYKVSGQTVFVTDIFDTRQDPEKMNT